MVDLESIQNENDFAELKGMIQNHFGYTDSARAGFILKNWETEKYNFWKVIPGEYKIALQKLEEEETASIQKEFEYGEAVNG